MEVSRILEVKRGDTSFDNPFEKSSTSDEKVSRFNSRQAMILGKWTVHSALREEVEQTPQIVKKETKFVLSLSPIVIQQDLYCISTTSSAGIFWFYWKQFLNNVTLTDIYYSMLINFLEFHNWPKKSDSIVGESGNHKTNQQQKSKPRGGSTSVSAATSSVHTVPSVQGGSPHSKTGGHKGRTGNLLNTLNNMSRTFNGEENHINEKNGQSQDEDEDYEQDDTGDYGCAHFILNAVYNSEL